MLAWVRRMSDAQRHRGPDGQGQWRSDGHEVVFGHRRLAIIDLSEAGAQPMRDPESGCVVTFNGEIYNFAEIRGELEALGDRFHSASDTEVILRAYRHWGIDAVGRFRGIFALALFDPAARVVHLVRDPMGIKPLYFGTVAGEGDEEILLFASEVRALLATDALPRRLDPAAVASYLWHGFAIGPDTLVKGIELLPAASVLSVELDRPAGARGARSRQYWKMAGSSERSTSVEMLREELTRTVRMQLVSDVPLGVFLSGGVDSSAIAALASRVCPGSIHTFNVGFDVDGYDERRYAEQVAAGIGSRHSCVVLTEQAFEQQLDTAFGALDQPTFDGINTYFVSRAARDAGMTVALAGTGGDELFGGYPSYREIPRVLRAGAWLPGGGRPGLAGRGVDAAVGLASRAVNQLGWNGLGRALPQTRWGKLADLLRATADPLGIYQVSYALFTREAQALLAGDAVRRAQRAQQFGLPEPVAHAWRHRIEGSELLHAVSLLELSSFVGERLLRDTDSASMAASLEARVPLLDHVLIDTIAGLEPGRRFSPLGRKQLLRDVALDRLDPAIFDRPKAGFVLPIARWARQRLQKQMDQVFADPELSRRAGLDGSAVGTLWRSFVAGRPGLYWSRVWAIYVLLTWCRTHGVSVDS